MGENGKGSKIEEEIGGLSPEGWAEVIRRHQAGMAPPLTASTIATTGGAVATGNGTAIGSAGTVIFHVQPTLPDGEPERSYLQRVLRETDDLPLEGVDPEAKANPNLRVRLRAIYTGLTVTGYRPEMPEKLDPKALEREQVRTISALEALGRERRLVLLGQPGGGKSTFVNFVAHCLAGELLKDAEANLATLCAPLPEEDGSDGRQPQPFSVTGQVPLRIVLRDFAASGRVRGAERDLWQYLEEKLAKVPAAEEGALLLRKLKKGEVLVLLDGLDEVPEPQKLRRTLVDSILAFERSFPACRFVVTSRVDPYRNQGWELPGFRVAELAPFSEGQIRAFLRRWYDHAAALRPNRFPETPAVRASWLERAIFRTRNLRELAGRPLLLTLMAAVHAWRGKLPDDRQQLYEEMVELLLARWEDRFERGPDQKRLLGRPEVEELAGCSQEELRHVLEALAYTAHAKQEEAQGTADIRVEDLLAALHRAARDGGNPKALVEYLKERAGLLLEREPGIFTFPHRSFQEYLAACHLLDQRPEPLEELVSRDIDRWREVALLAAAKKRATSRAEVWDLVARFCAVSAAEGAGEAAAEWRALVAGQVVSECFVNKGGLDTLGELDTRRLARVNEWQLALLRSAVLPPLERHRAGLVLGELGDPRFDPDFYSLPAEGNLGFIEIPAGKFLMGSSKDQDSLAFDWEMPQHEVDLPTYWIARFPVTVRQMAAFQRESGFELGDPDWATGAAHTPVVLVSAREAEAYCRWLEEKLRTQGGASFPGKLGELVASGRFRVCLPSEEQWEKAARGEGGSIYPWQGPQDAGRYNGAEAGIWQPSVVGAFASGASVFGVEEMSGNVWEWTSSPWCASYEEPVPDAKDSDNATRVVRGGAFDSSGRRVRCAYRSGNHPLDRGDYVGFRVALTPFSVP